MPLPTPRRNEDKKSFINRCMGNGTMNQDFPDQSQRRAVCEKQWDKGMQASAAVTYPQIVEFILTNPWAILPAKLNTIMSIVEAKTLGEDVTAASVNYPVQRQRDEAYAIVDNVAVIPVLGTILPRSGGLMAMSGLASQQMIQSALVTALDDDRIHSILLEFDSPGGAASGIPELGEMIRLADQEKPVHALANPTMASAAYWLGSQARSISVTPSGQVGSIGVLMAHADESKMWAQKGINFTYISAGKYKTEGIRTEPLSDEARQYLQGIVDQHYDEFIEAVAQGRNVNAESVRTKFGQGRMFRASNALELGMVDRVETIDEAITRISPGKLQSSDVTSAPVAAQTFSSGHPTYVLQLDSSGLAEQISAHLGSSHHGGDDMSKEDQTVDVTVGLSEEAQAEIDELKAQLDAVSQERDQLAETSGSLSERVASLEVDRREKLFTDIAMGRGGENDGQRFFGDIEQHVGLMVKLSDAFGEKSDEVKTYIEQQQKVAAAMDESALFESKGHGREPTPSNSAGDQFMSLVSDMRKEAVERGDTLSQEDAISQVAAEHPDLYRAMSLESSQRV